MIFEEMPIQRLPKMIPLVEAQRRNVGSFSAPYVKLLSVVQLSAITDMKALMVVENVVGLQLE